MVLESSPITLLPQPTPWGHLAECLWAPILSAWPLSGLLAFGMPYIPSQDGAGTQQVTSNTSLRTSARYKPGQILRIGSP